MAQLGALWWALLAMAAALAFAYAVERREHALHRWLAHPLTYALALGTYFSGWAYFGTGAALYLSGIPYLSHEIGWSFAFMFAWPLLLKAVRFARDHRVTTLPGFLAVRYGASPWLTGLTVAILVAAMVPYLTLQLQAIAFALDTLARAHGPASVGIGTLVPLWAFIVAAFAVLFGGWRTDPTRRLPGAFATLAVAGAAKLAVLLAVAAAAWWRFGPAVVDLHAAGLPGLRLDAGGEATYLVWMANLVMSMAGVVLLPHMFHLTVIEARDERQVRASRWGFPLYGWIFEVALVPVTTAGVLLGLSGPGLQGAILLVPGFEALRTLAFLGGVAAASGMAAMTMIALANTLVLDAILPVFGSRIRRAPGLLGPMRAALVAGLAIAATLLWSLGERHLLFEVGLVAFVALAQVAPAFFGGLVWPQLRGRAVGWGLAAASVVWLYTAMLPSLAPGAPALAAWVAGGPWGLGFLRPQALFGVEGLPPTVHAFLWCTLANLGTVWAVMAQRPPGLAEVHRARALLAGAAPPLGGQLVASPIDWERLDGLVASFVGAEAGHEAIARIRAATAAAAPEMRPLTARDGLERVLRGPLGAVAAAEVVAEEFPVSAPTLEEVVRAYRQLEQLLALSQEELAARIQELTRLKESLEARVTERTEALAAERDRLEAALDDLRALERLKTTFVNAVSHDLRIPLTGILGYAEFLEDEVAGPLSEPQREFVTQIMEATRRMTTLLNDLMDHARLEEGQFSLAPRALDLKGVVERAASTFYPAFERKRLRFDVHIPLTTPEVLADPDRLVQVLSNLFSNAAKFTPEGGAIDVRACVVPAEQAVRLEVTDTGAGIAPEDLPRLFQRYFQTAAGQDAGGTGLGLSISKALIEAHGGHMGATSVLGRGTTMWLTLPIAERV